jgi:hypothetical protein
MIWICENDEERINMTLCHLHGGWMEVWVETMAWRLKRDMGDSWDFACGGRGDNV